MENVDKLERQVKALSPEELAAFRQWFLAYEWEGWDRQLDQDIAAGKLDAHAEKALRDRAAGKSTKL